MGISLRVGISACGGIAAALGVGSAALSRSLVSIPSPVARREEHRGASRRVYNLMVDEPNAFVVSRAQVLDHNSSARRAVVSTALDHFYELIDLEYSGIKSEGPNGSNGETGDPQQSQPPEGRLP